MFVVSFASVSLAAEEEKVVIKVWQPWGGETGKDMDKLAEAYEKLNPGIDIKMVLAPNDLATNQKFFTAVAGGMPPEVIFPDGPQVAEWAHRELLAPLDKYVEEYGLKVEDFWGPSWRQSYYKGSVWALTYCTDPNFAFFWNKEVFEDAGLDPEKPPIHISDVDEYADKITQYDDVGNLTRMGVIPWSVYGGANSMYTWGWIFGGKFFDYDTNTVTANDPKNVKALEWMCSYAKKYDAAKVSALQQGFGSAETDPFYIVKLAMSPRHILGLVNIDMYDADLKYGLPTEPYPPDGEENSSWVGGWCMAIPNGAKHQDEAWGFIYWLNATPEGTKVVGDIVGWFPGYKPSPAFDEFIKDPRKEIFLNILKASKHQRPVIPTQGFYMGELARAVDFAVYGQRTPQQALDDATANVQKELDKALKK